MGARCKESESCNEIAREVVKVRGRWNLASLYRSG